MSQTEQPRLALTVSDLRNLNDVREWSELAEGIGIPPSSVVEVTGTSRSIKVTAYLAQCGIPEDVEPDPCFDSACTLGEHDDDSKHFDGQVAW